jgi:hypothetical protein
MTTDTIQIEILTPSEGYRLTQAADIDIQDRVISEKIFLAVTDKAENWKEITIEEANSILEEQERLMEEEMNKMEE